MLSKNILIITLNSNSKISKENDKNVECHFAACKCCIGPETGFSEDKIFVEVPAHPARGTQ